MISACGSVGAGAYHCYEYFCLCDLIIIGSIIITITNDYDDCYYYDYDCYYYYHLNITRLRECRRGRSEGRRRLCGA